jgi:hypothetical protein
MKVKFLLCEESGRVTLTREEGDRKYYGTQGARGERQLLTLLMKWLNERGFRLIICCPGDDGHMMGDEYQRYLRPPMKDMHRARPIVDRPQVFIYSGNYAIAGANEDWNRYSKVDLIVTCSRDDIPAWRDPIVAAGKKHKFEVELA